MSASNLPQAPGASTAKTTGILSIVLGVLCLPVGLVLAIVALVQHNKAKSAFAAAPGAYEPVGNVGLVTAIIGLVLPVLLAIIGIIAAIAIPALLGQRGRARDKAAMAALTGTLWNLTAEYDRQVEAHAPPSAIPGALEAKLKDLGREARNPWNPAAPPFVYTIGVVEGADPETLASLVRARATEKGTPVFLLAPPDPAQARQGWLAGAVRLQQPINGESVYTKTAPLD
ncbi:hypothetical protein [Geothrix sp. SG200]|uniref:hypothetical protein n=1 Tax=Geothrix sp. SG200 TaxID=2922865 RepID=UPI001FAD9A93|nr:hypothetical protein [Geothrix sp. SG200]